MCRHRNIKPRAKNNWTEGGWGGVRTHDLRVMSPTLSPTELPSLDSTIAEMLSRQHIAPATYIVVRTPPRCEFAVGVAA